MIYGDGDAPGLTGDSVLELTCNYRSAEDADVFWGAEGEATVWGKAERCSALVFYY